MAGKQDHAKNRGKFILRRVGDALLTMYRKERARILEATLRKRIYEITFEEVEHMDEQQRDVWRDCAFDEVRQILEEGFADNRAIQEEIQAQIKEIQEFFEKKAAMELKAMGRQGQQAQLKESLKKIKAKPDPTQKNWHGRRTKLSSLKIYKEVNDLFEAV